MNPMREDLRELGLKLWPNDAALRPAATPPDNAYERRSSRWVPVGVGALTAVALFAALALGLFLSHSRNSSAPQLTGTPAPTVSPFAIPAGTVPWAPLPPVGYKPTPSATPTSPPADARPCRARDLSVSVDPTFSGAGVGSLGVALLFLNTSSTACVLSGYPRAVLSEPGAPNVTARSDTFYSVLPTGNQAPGVSARLTLGFSVSCEATANPAPLYHHARIVLPIGDVTNTVLPQSKGVDASCGVTVSSFGVQQPQAPAEVGRFTSVSVTVVAPPQVKSGAQLTYYVKITNSGSNDVSLAPCPDFLQWITGLIKDSHMLNCGAAHPVPPGGQEDFAMQLELAGVAPGNQFLCWGLDDWSASAGCTAIQVRP